MGGIAGLERLFLGNNDLTGGVPSALGNLDGLENLNLSANDLSGSLPSSLGNLENLESLKLGDNSGLTGPLPYGLINSSLDVLLAAGTGICSPPDNRFQTWLKGVGTRSITRCPLSTADRETLVALYNATDGPNWQFQTNWLSNRPIDEWTGVLVDSTGHVSNLSLIGRGLSGEIPSSLGSLANLRYLRLERNSLTGSIPSELGNLSHLLQLFLHRNNLSGSIPSSLGRLENLSAMGLDANMLTGSIPTALGDLSKLRSLYLENNSLSGGIPSSLGKLTALRLLWVHNNESMSGSLPSAITGLTNMDTLRLDGTGLCVPRTSAFETWLDGIDEKQFEYCEAEN